VKKYTTLPGWALLLLFVLGGGWWGVTQSRAQSVAQRGRSMPSPSSSLFETNQLDEQFTSADPMGLTLPVLKPSFLLPYHRSDSIIYYDHWEDGLEPNLDRPVNSPLKCGVITIAPMAPPPGGRDVLQARRCHHPA
jgi:hypothetical protein